VPVCLDSNKQKLSLLQGPVRRASINGLEFYCEYRSSTGHL